jgi:MoaA/NifB/PqqE/SkfB family radical SAM enzyme
LSQASARGLVVSPYLHALSEEEVVAFIGAAERPLAAELEARKEAGDLAILHDAVRARLFFLTRIDALALGEIRRGVRTLDAMREEHPETIAAWTTQGIVVDEDAALRAHRYQSIEIETNRHCNFRCTFCPVAAAPKPKGLMSKETYARVLERVVEYGARVVSLNHYSEPTLDPGWLERIELAEIAGISVRLHTNASLLDEGSVRRLAELGNVVLVVNMPSVDRAAYERATGSKMFDRVMANLERLATHRVPVRLSINTPREGGGDEVEKINDLLEGKFGRSIAWPTDSRGGLVEDGSYAIAVRHVGRLAGCALAVLQLNVAHDGRAFLCCQDFNQDIVLGSVLESSIREIAESDAAVRIRRWLFGFEAPPADFLCARCEWTRPLREGAPLAVGSEPKHALVAMPSALRALPSAWI